MGAELGAEVDLEKAPLKYEGLSYTEIWISEAQERMVLAVPAENLARAARALRAGGGRGDRPRPSSSTTGRLTLRYHGQVVGDLSMDFLHEGRPPVVRSGLVHPAAGTAGRASRDRDDFTADLLALLRPLGRLQQGMDRPPVRPRGAGPDRGQAAGRRPRGRPGRRGGGPAGRGLEPRAWPSRCGINPRYGELDPYAMAACVIDEAIRNCVAVGADPDRIALLDNFCWGNPERPETLGSLVLAAQACHDLALAYETPFISGKDSLYNEYTHDGREPGHPADAADQRDRPGARRPAAA